MEFGWQFLMASDRIVLVGSTSDSLDLRPEPQPPRPPGRLQRLQSWGLGLENLDLVGGWICF